MKKIKELKESVTVVILNKGDILSFKDGSSATIIRKSVVIAVKDLPTWLGEEDV